MINKNIIFLGVPGSGKGTISSILEKELNYKQISTGDIFREEIKKESELGLKIKKIVDNGQYVPDDITNSIVKNTIENLNNQNIYFILDGYPRTKEQADFLSRLELKPFIVFNLEIDEEIIIKRLTQRLFCPSCKKTYNQSNLKSKKYPYCEQDEDILLIQRTDDKPEAIKKRLQIYNEQTLSLIEYYKNKNILISINSNNNLDIILNTIKEKLND